MVDSRGYRGRRSGGRLSGRRQPGIELALTQTLINQTRPGKFAIDWDRAWTFYPFRLHARGISVNGLTSSLQWQMDTAAASGQKDTPRWINRLLTIDAIQGNASMTLTQDRIIIPYAFAGSERADVGAKGAIDAKACDGVFYVRFRRLHALLKIEDGKHNLHLIRARQKFDAYSPSKVTLR